jgi:hypothetical protein
VRGAPHKQVTALARVLGLRSGTPLTSTPHTRRDRTRCRN